MSVVTDIILISSVDDNQAQDIAKRFQLAQIDQHTAGGKAMQADVYGAAYNHYNDGPLLEAFNAAEFDFPTLLMIQHEWDELFTTHRGKTRPDKTIGTTIYPPATSIHWYDGDMLTGNKLMADLDEEQCCGCGEHVLCVALRDKINPDECWCYHLCPSCLRAMANRIEEIVKC
jgi:hypothetical protein